MGVREETNDPSSSQSSQEMLFFLRLITNLSIASGDIFLTILDSKRSECFTIDIIYFIIMFVFSLKLFQRVIGF